MVPVEILNYIHTQRVGVLAVEMLDGSPHAATVHFANTENPLVFFFETQHDYRKAEALLGRKTSRASLVIGSDENNMKTLQLDGVVEILESIELAVFNAIYFDKFPQKKEKIQSNLSHFIFFKFTPTWWRFTDWKTPQGKLILTSK